MFVRAEESLVDLGERLKQTTNTTKFFLGVMVRLFSIFASQEIRLKFVRVGVSPEKSDGW